MIGREKVVYLLVVEVVVPVVVVAVVDLQVLFLK